MAYNSQYKGTEVDTAIGDVTDLKSDILQKVNKAGDTLNGLLKYNSSLTFTSDNDIINKKYIDDRVGSFNKSNISQKIYSGTTSPSDWLSSSEGQNAAIGSIYIFYTGE